MAITNLTNTSWYIKDTNCAADYGIFSINYTKDGDSYSEIYIGYYIGSGDHEATANRIFLDAGGTELSAGSILTITGGTDVADASLISWLTEHATQVPSDLTDTKWVLNSTVDLTSLGNHSINFVSNGTNYTVFKNQVYTYLRYDSTDVYNENGTWTNAAYRIIEITGGTDVTNATLIAWLAANATQVPAADLTDTEWVLNSSIETFNATYYLNFESNSTNYTQIQSGAGEVGVLLWYYDNGNTKVYDNGSWTDQAYRTISITGGTDVSNPDLLVWLTNNAEYQETPEPTGVKNILFGTQAIDKILFGQSEVSKIYLGQTLVYEAGSEPPTPSVDPVLNNNSWAVIAQVCNAGQAADYWNVGDTKNVTAGGYTRPVMIVDMSHGRTVFMFRNRTEQDYVWQPTAIDGYYNNYSTSQMRTTHLASGGGVRTALLDADLSAVLTVSSYKVATNGNDGTLLTLSDELWLPAEKELTQTRVYSRQDEFDALTTFDYFIANDNNTARKCPKASAPTATSGNIYWERSPYGASSGGVCLVGSSGDLGFSVADDSRGVAPCFAFTPTN